jgi:phage-related protein
MPATEVFFYQEEEGETPVLDWLIELRKRERKAYRNCVIRIRLLEQFGRELRRPHADYLRDGIHELRTKAGRVQYRILYFYHGRNVCILAHGITKEKEVPSVDVERAIRRKLQYESDPSKHRGLAPPDDL